MQTVLKNDLNLSPYKITKAQVLSQATKTKKLQRAKLLLENLRDGTQPPVLWTAEWGTILKLTGFMQWIRVTSPWMTGWRFWGQKPASVMVWAWVTSTGEKTPLIFIEEWVKVNQHVYLDLLKNKLVPGLMQHSEKVELFCSRMEPCPTHLITFRSGVRGTWLGSGRRNPTDFAILSIMESKACSLYHLNIGALKNRLKACWNEIFEETVHASCSQVPDRSRCVVKTNGGYIENEIFTVFLRFLIVFSVKYFHLLFHIWVII